MPTDTLPADPWIASLLAVVVVSALPLAVTYLLARREHSVRRYLPQISALGAGAVLAAALAGIIPEALERAPIPFVAIGVAFGYVAFWGIERLLASHDHAHAHGLALGAPPERDTAADHPGQHVHRVGDASGHEHGHPHGPAFVPLAFTGDALHNLVDGILIAAGFLTGTSVGLLTLLAVALHELPRELGTFGLLVHGGVPAMKAVRYNLATAGLSLLGALATLALGSAIASLATLVLPVAAGTYLYIAGMVLRVTLRGEPGTPPHWARVGWVGVGAAVVMAAGLLH